MGDTLIFTPLPDDMTPIRDVEVVGECPKCNMPGVHLMPKRVLVGKLDEEKVLAAKRVRDRAKRRYDDVVGRASYRFDDWLRAERQWLNEADEAYAKAQAQAERYQYLLLRVCFLCAHQWVELIREFMDDDEATLLRERYPRGLVRYRPS
jgi:hypothetical protein